MKINVIKCTWKPVCFCKPKLPKRYSRKKRKSLRAKYLKTRKELVNQIGANLYKRGNYYPEEVLKSEALNYEWKDITPLKPMDLK